MLFHSNLLIILFSFLLTQISTYRHLFRVLIKVVWLYNPTTHAFSQYNTGCEVSSLVKKTIKAGNVCLPFWRGSMVT